MRTTHRKPLYFSKGIPRLSIAAWMLIIVSACFPDLNDAITGCPEGYTVGPDNECQLIADDGGIDEKDGESGQADPYSDASDAVEPDASRTYEGGMDAEARGDSGGDNDSGEEVTGSDSGTNDTGSTDDTDGCTPASEGDDCDSDNLDCTDDVCRNGVCVHELRDRFCLIEDSCYDQYQDNPDNECQHCDFNDNETQWSDKSSDEPCGSDVDDRCTEPDTCDGNGVCQPNHMGSTTTCDDQDPMTYNDLCRGDGSCAGTAYCDVYTCWKIPPTGQTECYDNDGSVISPCPGTAGDPSCASTDFCGQDAQYPDNPRSFTEETIAGYNYNELEDAIEDAIVTDSLNGLVWQKDYATNRTWAEAESFCNTINGAHYAGYSDWRRPDVRELSSLINFGRLDPASDFPGTPSEWFWATPTRVNDTGFAWDVNFDFGRVGYYMKSEPNAVRCIRDRAFNQGDMRFHQIGIADPIILDRATGLMWGKGVLGSSTWQMALEYCEESNRAGYSDWRLPNIHELYSLVNVELYDPATDFPSNLSNWLWLWSSSSTMQFPDQALCVDFQEGATWSNSKTANDSMVKCVRGEN